MTDWNLIIAIGYVQAGLLLLGYLVYRRIGELRARLALQQAGYDWSLRRAEEIVAGLERRLRGFAQTSGQAQPKPRWRTRHRASVRRQAAAMLRQGATVKNLIESLNLRRPEALLLAKVEGMRSAGET